MCFQKWGTKIQSKWVELSLQRSKFDIRVCFEENKTLESDSIFSKRDSKLSNQANFDITVISDIFPGSQSE